MYTGVVYTSMLLLLASCQNGCKSSTSVDPAVALENTYSKEFSQIMVDKSSLFRGWSLDSAYTSVAAKEKERLSELTIVEDGKILGYQMDLGDNDLAALTYNFEDNKLVEIQLDANIREAEKGNKIITDFTTYFTSKMGNTTGNKGGYTTWSKDEGIRAINIELSDEAQFSETTPHKLQLYIYILGNPDYKIPKIDTLKVQG